MPEVDIYYNGKKIETKQFSRSFYIIKELGSERLYWETGQEQRSSQEGGEIHIWIQTVSSSPRVRRRIIFVRPDWQLVVDGTIMEKRFYTELEVEGRAIELRYNNYCFICLFR